MHGLVSNACIIQVGWHRKLARSALMGSEKCDLCKLLGSIPIDDECGCCSLTMVDPCISFLLRIKRSS